MLVETKLLTAVQFVVTPGSLAELFKLTVTEALLTRIVMPALL